MAGKKKKNKSKKQKKKGFAQRTVSEPEAKAAGNGPKKGGWLQALGGIAKHLAGKTLDGLAIVQPELAPIRGLVKAKYGFAERDVTPGSEEGGTVVHVEDAPVAFARKPMSTGMKTLGKTARGGEVVWVRDQVSGTLTTNAVINTFTLGTKYLIPGESALFPNFYQEFLFWERWRPLKCVLHFCHFASTAQVAAVLLGYISAANFTASTVVTNTNKFMGYEHAVQGSCYEDFAIVIEDDMWKEGTWLGNYASASNDASNNCTGQLIWATDANVVLGTAVGYLYVELVFEVCDKRPSYSGAGLIMEAHICSRYCKTDREWDLLFDLLNRRLLALWKKERAARAIAVENCANMLDIVRASEDARAAVQIQSGPVTAQTANPQRLYTRTAAEAY